MAAGGRGSLAAAAREEPGPAVAAAEEAAAEVVRRVRPTEVSERRRAEVVDYARRLVGAALGCEVFAYGSVPLKTYLPDGDIDLTILGNTSHDSTLVDDVYCILDSEEQNSDAEFEVKDLDLINAEVRLIKCTIENIIVDISFNQTGGICALCFLELVDRKVGKNHLFKRSIILIKAWCYYESRLLGAHHGLISTYALEILILYIFNIFHKSLCGPLEVLYRFLEYFGKFDWDNYCISLNGPVALSSLPNLTVEATGTHTDDLLFDKEFLKSSVDEVFVAPRYSGQSGSCYTRFRPKHLNIIDPLKEYNNLGRSVNGASFRRIRTAFSYGSQKLGQILMLQSELIPNEIYGFFKNTLGRNGRGFRPDVASTGMFQPSFGTGKDILEELSSLSISYRKGDENGTSHDLSRSSGDNGSYVTNGPTRFSNCLRGGHNTGSSTDLRSSHLVHHETKQLSYCTAKTFDLDDRSLIESRVHVNNQIPTLNSYADVNNLATDKKSWSAPLVKKQRLPPLPLRLPDLSGDLDFQFRCLRQVQYHLEYLFDGFLQSVQEASSNDKFQEGPFHIPTLNILLDAHATLPGLLFPSSVESNGMKLSPVSCSHSTEAISQHTLAEEPWDVACQQNISLPSETDIPSNGLSPSSYVGSDSSLYSSEDSPEMHETDTFFPRKSYEIYKERLTPSRENGKIMTNRPVQIESNQSSAPVGIFVPYEEQVVLPGRTKEITIGQPMKKQGHIHPDRKAVEHSCDPRKEFIRYDDKTRKIPKYNRDICLNMNILQNQQYGTNMEFARTPGAMWKMPKYQPCNSTLSIAKKCTNASLGWSLPRKESYGTRKEDEIPDWSTRHLPSYEPLKLQNQQCGRVCSKKYSAGKQSYNNHEEDLSFVTGAKHIPCNGMVSNLNGIEKGTNSNKFDESYGTRKEDEIPDSSTSHLPSYESLKLQNQQRGRVCSKKYSAGTQSYNNHKEDLSFVTGAEHIPCNGVVSNLNGIEKETNSNKFDENGKQLWPLLREMPLPLHSTNSQEKPPVSDTSLPSFPSTNGSPLETIEFGSLGPFASTVSSKSKKVTNTHPVRKVLTDASASVAQRPRAGARHSRSPESCKVGNEDEFPPLNAVVR